MNRNVLIAGAGLGGIALALRLAKKGYTVKIIEKNDKAGGRLNQLKKDGFTFDTGPSFFSMSYEFERFAQECDIRLPFSYYSLDPLYTVSFSNNPRTYFLYKDIGKLAEQFKDTEPDFARKMEKYLEKGRQLFEDTMDVVIRRNHDTLPEYMMNLMKVNPVHLPIIFRNFWQQVSHYFTSEEARQIISLVSFFLGRTPFDTASVYTLLSYTEFRHDGYFNVEGGMYRIVEGLVEELRKEKIEIIYNTEITGYEHENNTLKSLVDSTGRKWSADIFAVNADAAVFRGKILGRKEFSEKKLDSMEWTMGSLTMYLGVNCKLPSVNHHNYYLGSNFREYADKVYSASEIMEKPYYYVNVLSGTNPTCAPEGCESLFFVCPVPDLRYKKSWHDKDAVADSLIDDFSSRVGINIKDKIVSRTVYTPVDWQQQFNLHRGSGLGLSHKMLQIGGFRPKNRDEKFKNLYYTGASTIPGTGLPMVIISSKLTFEQIEKYASRGLS
ncbi:MAG TPA: phytoene desaturase family protein [Bacteroidales bacterium]|nr:phytoene desaturase family protein [Bacteroidales bacterium]